MTAAIIGLSLGIVIILALGLVRSVDKKTMYGLILAGIGFLYVGFTWTDTLSLVVTAIQAILFVFLSYYGIRKSLSFLVAGYFLHGLWDLAYSFFQLPRLIPPHYDLFCLSIDFTMGLYLAFLPFFKTKKE
jgi:hypothetical protein